MLTRNEIINRLSELGKYLESDDPAIQKSIELAGIHNSWFTAENCQIAMRAIATQYLNKDLLLAWAKKYDFAKTPKTIGIVMAGNIPLVGFHDLLAVLVSGHKALVKLSSKDEILPLFIMSKLKGISPRLENRIQTTEGKLENFDAVIATGSNNTARYFNYYFNKYPNIIRKNRNSVAVLSGHESDDDLRLLGTDIFTYFGLGCRNVSKLFVPAGYNFNKLLHILDEYNDVARHTKYKNNFDYNLTLFLLNKEEHLCNDCCILTRNEDLASRIAVLHYEEYNSLNDVREWIKENAGDIQCVVGEGHLPFGSSQRPTLSDYADNIDTLRFLNTFNQ